MAHPLHELLHGDLAAWRGLPRNADTAWVREALGDDVVDRGGLLRWRGGATGPEGALISLAGDRVELVELPHPSIPLEAVDALGAPELELRTPWSRVGSQRAWPSRGLAVHAHFNGVVRVMAFAPMDPETFRAHRFATTGRPPERRPRR